jgi:glycosyltransferase involved in cell wall biosynthesis
VTINICICTRNRAASLRKALASLAAIERRDALRWDVLVVDNGSSDGTAAVATEFASVLPLRLARAPEPGQSHARNTALAQSNGSHIIFIDDDVTVSSGWLAAYASGFERYPQAAFFGGPIVAKVPGVSGRQLAAVRKVIPGALTWLDPGLTETALTRKSATLPWGANMAFRRSAVDGREFDPNLGRGPNRGVRSGEETRLFETLLAAGATGVWLPDAKLDHHVSSERCSENYLRDYCRGVGWYYGYLEASEGIKDIGKVQRWIGRTLLKRRLCQELARCGAPLESRLSALRDLEVLRGFEEGFTKGLKTKAEGARR